MDFSLQLLPGQPLAELIESYASRTSSALVRATAPTRPALLDLPDAGYYRYDQVYAKPKSTLGRTRGFLRAVGQVSTVEGRNGSVVTLLHPI